MPLDNKKRCVAVVVLKLSSLARSEATSISNSMPGIRITCVSTCRSSAARKCLGKDIPPNIKGIALGGEQAMLFDPVSSLFGTMPIAGAVDRALHTVSISVAFTSGTSPGSVIIFWIPSRDSIFAASVTAADCPSSASATKTVARYRLANAWTSASRVTTTSPSRDFAWLIAVITSPSILRNNCCRSAAESTSLKRCFTEPIRLTGRIAQNGDRRFSPTRFKSRRR